MLHMMKRHGCKGRKATAVMAAASLASAAIGAAALLVGKSVNDDESKEFPWLAVGIAAAALMLVGLLALVQWRRKAENRSDSEEDGPCSP